MSKTHPPIIATKGQKVRLIKEIQSRLQGIQRVPKVGTIGKVLAVQIETHDMLIKWPARRWPIAVTHEEVERVHEVKELLHRKELPYI